MAKLLSPSLPREYPLVVLKGRGQWIEDVDGNEYLDFTSGIAVCNTGHCHPDVVAAAQAQIAVLIHMCGSDFYHLPMIELAECLATITPGSYEKRVLLANSGAEAVEDGFKLARWHSGRDKAIAFLGAFHGRTHGRLVVDRLKGPSAQRIQLVCSGNYACSLCQLLPLRIQHDVYDLRL